MSTRTVTPEAVEAELKQIFDPEIPVNIHDLGLIYGVEIDGGKCRVEMTLTSQACPEARTIPEIVRQRVCAMEGVDDCSVDIVWEPMWTPQLISAEGRRLLGIEDPPEPAAE